MLALPLMTLADIEVRRARVACMVPLSMRLILETNKEQNARGVLARLKKLFDFELGGARAILQRWV